MKNNNNVVNAVQNTVTTFIFRLHICHFVVDSNNSDIAPKLENGYLIFFNKRSQLYFFFLLSSTHNCLKVALCSQIFERRQCEPKLLFR